MSASDELPSGPPQISEEIMNRLIAHRGKIFVQVKHSGLKRTKPSVVEPHLKKLESCETMSEFLEKFANVHNRLMGMNIFQEASFALEPLPAGNKNGIIANVHFSEEANQSASFNVSRENHVTTPEVSFASPNFLGRAIDLRLQMQGTLKAHKQASLILRSKNPSFGEWIEWALTKRIAASQYHALRREDTTSLRVTMQEAGHTVDVGYDLRLLTTDRVDRYVSEDLRKDEGESDKAYIRHTWVPCQPFQNGPFYQGFGIRVQNEISEGVRLAQHDVQAEYHLPIVQNLLSLGLHVKGAIAHAFGGVSRVRVNDRFHLDGNFVRGYRAIGPGCPEATTTATSYTNGGSPAASAQARSQSPSYSLQVPATDSPSSANGGYTNGFHPNTDASSSSSSSSSVSPRGVPSSSAIGSSSSPPSQQHEIDQTGGNVLGAVFTSQLSCSSIIITCTWTCVPQWRKSFLL